VLDICKLQVGNLCGKIVLCNSYVRHTTRQWTNNGVCRDTEAGLSLLPYQSTPSCFTLTSFPLGNPMAASSRKKCTKLTCKSLCSDSLHIQLTPLTSPSASPSESESLCGLLAPISRSVLQREPTSTCVP
jgi:hypothetical protein